MYQSVETCSTLLNEKRTKFRVEIRRKRMEETFQEKRAIFVSNKDLEQLSQFALQYYLQQDEQEAYQYLVKINNYADNENSSNLKSLITISNLNYIIYNCNEKLFTIILQIYQKINMLQCLSVQLLGQIQKFEDGQLTEEFARFLLKIAQNNPLNILIEQYDFINYLLDISLLLDNYEDWFLILEELSKYKEKSSFYFKKLIIPAFKLIEYDTNFSTLQLVVCMCQCQQNNKDSINYLLLMPGFIKWVIECIEKKQQSTLYIISVIIEESDQGTIQLIQEGLLKILSNLFYEMNELQSSFIYIVANICYIKNQYVIQEVLQSEIFLNILALTDRELLKDDYICISQMLYQLIRKYTNEVLYLYFINKTDFVYMLGYLLQQYLMPNVFENTISCILHILNTQSDSFLYEFRMKIYGKQIEQLLHSKDKLYVTYSEHQLERGGKKENKQTPLTRLPFDHCSLSLEPFQNAVCTIEGHVFDIVNIVPFIRKYKKNPINGQPLKMTDLIQLKFHKNDKGQYHDPISFKVFTDHTKLVAIKTSGNVYTNDTIEELNRKPKFWKDLLTGEIFNYKDIIILQDPKNIESRTIKNFDFLKNNLRIDQSTDEIVYVNLNDTGKRIMEMAQEQNVVRHQEQVEREKQSLEEIEEIKKKVKTQVESNQMTVKEFLELSSKSGDFVSERYATEHDSVSVTSTQMTLKTKPLGQVQYRNMNEDEIRKLLYDRLRKSGQKGYVQLITNYGNINFELHCDLVPMTCENFLELCEKGYYSQTKFHKLIENELVEGGDPTATGYGGESIFGKPFRIEINNLLSHSKAGIVSMGNLGANHQTSHFFITLAECKKYDGKYAVFGEVVGGFQTLYQINKLPVNMWQRPEVTIRLKEIKVIKNPFREMIKIILQEKELEKEERQQAKEKEKERWLDNDGFTLPTKISQTSQMKGLGLASNLIQQFNIQEVQKKQLKQFNFDSWL